MKEHLLQKSYRDYFLFTFGINSGLWASDILPLSVMDVRYTEHLRIREKKTGNVRKIKMTAALKQEIEKYTRQMADYEPLFPSRKGKGYLSREMAWRVINGSARACGGGRSHRHPYFMEDIRIPFLPTYEGRGDVAADFWPFGSVYYPSIYWH
jgi:site-specific recombinase XerD